MKAIHAIVIVMLAGCTSSSAPSPRTASDTSTATATPAASVGTVEPNKAKAISHFKEHVKYPATRSEILAACAQTPEFTAAEKDWLAQRLPEGTYKNPDEVVVALRF